MRSSPAYKACNPERGACFAKSLPPVLGLKKFGRSFVLCKRK